MKFKNRFKMKIFPEMNHAVVAIFALFVGFGALAADDRGKVLSLDGAGEAAQVFYVSPHGDDRWSGLLADPRPDLGDGPFATIERARDAVRSLRGRRNLKLPVKVKIREGTYFLNQPIVFQPRDSGTEASPVIYQAYSGERPVISGGRVIENLQSEDGRIYRAMVAEAKNRHWVFRQLFVENERMTLARTPNSGYFRFAGPADMKLHAPANAREERFYEAYFYRFHPGQLKAWENMNDVNLVTFFSWHIGILNLAWVDEVTLTFRTLRPNLNGLAGRVGEEMRYFVENSPDCLDAPGEWQLNRDSGELQVIPHPGQLDSSSKAIAPRLEHLLILRGHASQNRWVEHIRFEGLSFRHTEFPFAADGWGDTQAALTVSAAVELESARNVAFIGNEFTQIGNHALWMRDASNRIRVMGNHFHDLGGGGVYIGNRDQPQRPGMRFPPPPAGRQLGFSLIENNLIHEVGLIFNQAHGVWIGQSSNNVIRHNEISHTNYTPIALGWSWSFEPTGCNHNIVEFNNIHNGMRNSLPDGGGIYTIGRQEGTIIRYNLIRSIQGYRQYQGAGIYPDEGSSEIVYFSNIVHDTSAESIGINYAKNLLFENNLLAGNASGAQIKRGSNNPGAGESGAQLKIRRNVLHTAGAVFSGPGTLREVNKNLYLHRGEAALPAFPSGADFETWRKQSGWDADSLLEPIDHGGHLGDGVRINPFEIIGYQPVDLARIGLYGEDAWRKMPELMATRYARPSLPPFAHYWPDIRDAQGCVMDAFEAGSNLAIHYLAREGTPLPRASHLRFEIRDAHGGQVRLDRFSFAARAAATTAAPTKYELRTSGDDFETIVAEGEFRRGGESSDGWHFYEHVISPLRPVTDRNLEVRLYLLGADGTQDEGSLRLDDIVIMATRPGHRIQEASLPTIFTYKFESESLTPTITTEALTPTNWRAQDLTASPVMLVNLPAFEFCNYEPSKGYTGASGELMLSGITGDSYFLPRRRTGNVWISTDRSLVGERSLKVQASPNQDAAFRYDVTSISYNPMVAAGWVDFSFGLFMESSSGVLDSRLLDLDDKSGVDFQIRFDDGALLLNGVSVAKLPTGEWLRVSMEFGVGYRNDGTWRLNVANVEGDVLFNNDDLTLRSDFGELRALEWHSQSRGARPTVFFLDEVKMTPR